MNFYFEDCTDEFVQICNDIGMNSEEIHYVLNLSTNSTPRTWFSSVARNHADVVGNWFQKELSRSGDSKRNSQRRCNLYLTRRSMKNYADSAALRKISPKFCKVSGQPINYGLGVTKEIYDKYYVKKYGKTGISPSLERIDPNKGYSIGNIEIISSFENVGRNMAVNSDYLREVHQVYNNLKNSIPRQIELLRLLQTGACHLTFKKVDGSKRKMNATLDLSVIPHTHHPVGEKKTPDHIINVWDLDQQSWKSFSYHRLIKVEI